MDFAEDLLQHYIDLFQRPAWRAYVRQRVLELAAEHPQEFGHYAQRMRERFPAGWTQEETTP